MPGISAAIIENIKTKLVEPTYYSDTKNCIVWRDRWQTISNYTDTFGEICGCISVILAFTVVLIIIRGYLSRLDVSGHSVLFFGHPCLPLNKVLRKQLFSTKS